MQNLYLLLLIMAVFMIWTPWLWRYYVRPFMEKRKLNCDLKKHPDWEAIKKAEAMLERLYKGVNGKRASQRECKHLGLTHRRDYVYGEIEFLSFFTILDKVKPQAHEKFYDLGCGAGKAVLATACYFDLSQYLGIEILPGLCALANQQLIKAQNDSSLYSQKLARVQFVNENFLHYDFSDGDIIFINATAFSWDIWDKLCMKLLELKQGARVITTSKKIPNNAFELIYQGRELMSWGLNSVYIYTRDRSKC